MELQLLEQLINNCLYRKDDLLDEINTTLSDNCILYNASISYDIIGNTSDEYLTIDVYENMHGATHKVFMIVLKRFNDLYNVKRVYNII